MGNKQNRARKKKRRTGHLFTEWKVLNSFGLEKDKSVRAVDNIASVDEQPIQPIPEEPTTLLQEEEPQGVPKVVRVKPPHNHPPSAADLEATMVRCQIRERCRLEPDLRLADVLQEAMATCTPEVREYLLQHSDSIRRDLARTRAAAVGGELPKSKKRKATSSPNRNKKVAKKDILLNNSATSCGNQSAYTPEGLSTDPELSPSRRNIGATPQIKEEFKDEIMLEDYENSNSALGDTYFEETESNGNTMDDSNVMEPSSSKDVTVPFETVDCGDIQVKQEIIEDETYDFETVQEPIGVLATSKFTDAVSHTVITDTTQPYSIGFSGSREKADSLNALARLANTVDVANLPSQTHTAGTSTLGYTNPPVEQTSSQPLAIAATTPNYKELNVQDSYTSITNYSTATTTNYCPGPAISNYSAAISTAANIANPPKNHVANAPGQPPRDEPSSRIFVDEDPEGFFISLKKVPLERRKKTKDKLLRLVKLITELDLDPDEVSFSVTTK